MNRTFANTNIAHTVGNMTAFMREFIKNMFGDKYFRHIHVASRLAYREQKREENSDYEFIKNKPPILIIRPKVEIYNDDIFGAYSRLMTNYDDMSQVSDCSNMMPFYTDKVKGCAINYLMNRIRVYFDCTVRVETEYEQINMYHYIRTRYMNERPYWVNTSLEFPIPRDMIEYVAHMSGVPITGDNGTVKDFLDYMNTHSNKYITMKKNNASSQYDFFMYYPLTVEYIFTDFSKEDPSKHNWATDYADISFTIATEFNAVGLFEFTAKNAAKELGMDLSIKTNTDDAITIIPYFTISNLFEHTKCDNGFVMYASQIFDVEPQADGSAPPYDILDMSPLFEKTNIKDIIVYHNEQGIPNDILLQFIVMKNNEQLHEVVVKDNTNEGDFEINWDDLSLKIYNIDVGATYRLVIYLNNLYIQQLGDNYNNTISSYEQPVSNHDKRGRTTHDDEQGIK